jgi:hypothetical protein
MEIWKPIPGWEDSHEVSDQGRVRTVDREVVYRDGRKTFYPSKVLSQTPALDYLRVRLCHKGKRATAKIHHLVLSAFVGPKPVGLVCCHADGNPRNNCLSNLRWDTYAANTADRRKHGNAFAGMANPSSKLTLDQVEELRLAMPGTINALCRSFGVTYQTAKSIRRGESWV